MVLLHEPIGEGYDLGYLVVVLEVGQMWMLVRG